MHAASDFQQKSWKLSVAFPTRRFISSVTPLESILLSVKHPVTTIQRVVADGQTAVYSDTKNVAILREVYLHKSEITGYYSVDRLYSNQHEGKSQEATWNKRRKA